MNSPHTIIAMSLREYRRTPLLVALLVVLPAYFVIMFAWLVPSQPIDIVGVGIGRRSISTQDVTAVLMAPMATALISGIAGLFLVQSAKTVDQRLTITGWRLSTLLVARGGIVLIAVVLATSVATGVLTTVVIPDRPGWFFLATVLVGLMYGMIGALVGLVFNRLAGVYVLLFVPMLDLFLAQNPLTADSPPMAAYLPGHYPIKLAVEAAFSTDPIATAWWWAIGYVGLLAAIAAVAFQHTAT